MTQEFLFGALIIVAGLIFFWRMRKAIQAISKARAEKAKAPGLEWSYIVMGVVLIVLLGLNLFGIL